MYFLGVGVCGCGSEDGCGLFYFHCSVDVPADCRLFQITSVEDRVQSSPMSSNPYHTQT